MDKRKLSVQVDGQKVPTWEAIMKLCTTHMHELDHTKMVSGMALTMAIVAVVVSVATAIVALQ